MKAKRQGRGADAIDQKGLPFEIRESRLTPKFRLQKDVHDELCRRGGYYLFKRGEEITKMFARDVDKLLKKGKWNRDRKYAYKFLHCKDLTGSGLIDQVKDENDLVSIYSEYFSAI